MQMPKMSLRVKYSSAVTAALVLGAVLGVGGSVLATSVGNSISVTTDLTVTTNTGLGTTSPGMVFAVQGVGNFVSTGSTIYSTLTFPSFTATSTTANNGIGTTTPGSYLSIQGVGNFANTSSLATSTLYSDLSLRSLSATSTIYGANGTAAVPSYSFFSDTDTGIFRGAANALGFATAGAEVARFNSSGNLGVATDTPGTLLSVQGVANFAVGSTTIYRDITVPRILATSTIATSTFANGLNIATSNGAVGVGTTTAAKTLSVAGDALIGSTGTTTLSITTSTASTGSCMQMRAGSSTMLYRIYVGTSANQTALVVEQGSCQSQAWGQ